MTAPRQSGVSAVDVLAVIDHVSSVERDWGDTQLVQMLTEARAAVAELIEVSRELLEYRVGTYPARGDLRDNAGSRAQLDALATALARCKVGAA